MEMSETAMLTRATRGKTTLNASVRLLYLWLSRPSAMQATELRPSVSSVGYNRRQSANFRNGIIKYTLVFFYRKGITVLKYLQ